MLFWLLSRVSSTVAGFIFPVYQSYKAIKAGDVQQLEVWCMYWTVLGIVSTAENTVEWLFTWIPFYYEFKTVVILWLTLPQIQGSTYIYLNHVHPFLSEHEEEIDGAIAQAKGRAKRAGLEWLNKLAHNLKGAILGSIASAESTQVDAASAGSANAGPPKAGVESAAPGASSQLYNLAGSYLRAYGPAVIATGSALLQPNNGRANSVRDLGRGAPPRNRATSNRLKRPGGFEAEFASALEPGASSSREPSPLGSSSSGNGSDYAPPAYTTGRKSSAPLHPRSVSAGHPSQGPYAMSSRSGQNAGTPPNSRVPSGRPPRQSMSNLSKSTNGGLERSYAAYGFEEIRRDEVSDYPLAGMAGIGAGGGRSVSDARKSGSWWPFAPGQGEYQPLPTDNDGHAKAD